jgi:hypothetical protein
MQSLFATVKCIFEQLCKFCDLNNHEAPKFEWVATHGITTMQQYPAGLSRNVLLTELEHKWRTVVRRGEHAGRLKQVLGKKVVSMTDVLLGNLSKVDNGAEFNYRLTEEGESVNLLTHEQFNDWTAFCHRHGVEPLAGRDVRVTSCRLLLLHPPVLLPTPLLSFTLDARQPADTAFIKDTLMPLYASLVSDNFPPDKLGGAIRCVIAQIRAIGTTAKHPTHSGSFRVVKLELTTVAPGARNLAGVLEETLPLKTRFIFLLLLEDKVHLADLWKRDEVLFLYRPYLAENDGEALFGKRTEVRGGAAQGAFDHDDVVRCADDLLQGALDDPSVASVHMLVSEITMCAVVTGLESGKDSGSGLLSPKKPLAEKLSAEAATTEEVIVRGKPLNLHEVNEQSHLPRAPFPQFARLVMRGESVGVGDLSFTYLWFVPESPGDGSVGDVPLLRVRCLNKILSSPALKHHVQPGQVYFLDELYAERESLIDGQDSQNWLHSSLHNAQEEGTDSGSVPAQWAQKVTRVFRLSLGKGPFGTERKLGSSSWSTTSSARTDEPLLVNASRLAALVSSPSIVQPVRLASYQQTWSKHGLGCILVLAIVKCFVSGDNGKTMLQLVDGASTEVLAEVDEHCVNLTQLLPSHVGPGFDAEVANSSALSAKWKHRTYVMLLSRLDDLDDAAAGGVPRASAAQRFRLNCITDVPAVSAEDEAQQLQQEKRARRE